MKFAQAGRSLFPRTVKLSVVFFLCLGLATAAMAQGSAAPPVTKVEQLTNLLVSAVQGGGASAATEMRSVAQQRHDLLLKLAASSPGDAWRLMLPADVAGKLPSAIRPMVESDADEQGTLEVRVEDYPDHTHQTLYFLDTARERLRLYFAKDRPHHLLTGTRVRARGKRLDGAMLLQSGSTSDATSGLQTLALASPNTFGAQSTVVLLVNFQDNSAQPYTVDTARNLVFTTVSNFDMENSQNQTWLTGDAFGWFTIAMSSGVCDSNTLASLANQAATSAGAKLNNYKRIVYGFPQNACGWSGLGSIGGNPSQAWINGSFNLLVVGHEMGHNFGLYHAHALVCPGSTLGSNCSTNEYGDVFDIMGNYTASHFDPYHKEQLGWLNYGSSLPITTVSGSGTYTLAPYENTSGTKALKILKGTDASSGAQTFYYVEYRQPIGFDSTLSNYPASISGVLVHSGASADPNSSYLLDMNPQSSTFSDAALAVGQTFTDSTAGVTIALASANASGASVNVTLGTSSCSRGTPNVSITPAQASAAAGATVPYTVSVTNKDSSACSTGNFNLAASVPAGWSATLAAPSLTLAPGASGSTSLQVTSPASASNGVSTVTVSASNAAATAFTGSASATYTVDTPTAANFALSASPGSVSVGQGGNASTKVTSTISGSFSSAVSLSASGMPAGVTATFSPTSLAAPGLGTSTLGFNASASTAAGTYSITVTGSGGELTRTTAVPLTITAAPPPPPPPPPPPSGSYTLFSNTATPAVLNANAGGGLDLGMKFTADSSGYVAGVRFYKGTSNTGAHVGSLWTATGQLLAQATFTNEAASGWQQVDFSSPVAIAANTVYVVSYHSAAYYSYTLGNFNSPLNNPPLHAVLNTTSSNGVYSYGAGSAFPIVGAAGANFWVDMVFTTGISTASLMSIAVTPANPSIGAGSAQQFQATGTYSDNSTRDITGQVTWASATPSVATINSAGLATGVIAGSSVIKAIQGAVSGSTTLTVSGSPPPPPPPSNSFSLFPSTATPAVVNANAGGALDVGMKFTADRSGSVTGVRFYKGPSNAGTHVASLWTSGGQLLAQATFANETASGWQQVTFTSPVPVTADTTYVVSYHSAAYYSYTLGTFTSPVTNSPLRAVVNASSGNGVYSYGNSSAFPTTGAAGANFWVDVVFQ